MAQLKATVIISFWTFENQILLNSTHSLRWVPKGQLNSREHRRAGEDVVAPSYIETKSVWKLKPVVRRPWIRRTIIGRSGWIAAAKWHTVSPSHNRFTINDIRKGSFESLSIGDWLPGGCLLLLKTQEFLLPICTTVVPQVKQDQEIHTFESRHKL